MSKSIFVDVRLRREEVEEIIEQFKYNLVAAEEPRTKFYLRMIINKFKKSLNDGK